MPFVELGFRTIHIDLPAPFDEETLERLAGEVATRPGPGEWPRDCRTERLLRRLDMVGNAHLDAVWLWPWQEGYEEARATFRSALDRLMRDPDFIFTCDSIAYYAWVEENDPETVRARCGPRAPKVAGCSPAAGGSNPTATSRRRIVRPPGSLRSAVPARDASAGSPRSA